MYGRVPTSKCCVGLAGLQGPARRFRSHSPRFHANRQATQSGAVAIVSQRGKSSGIWEDRLLVVWEDYGKLPKASQRSPVLLLTVGLLAIQSILKGVFLVIAPPRSPVHK